MRHVGPSREVVCDECLEPFQKQICQINKTSHNFCTRRCAAIFNNRAMPKRKARIIECVVCRGGFSRRGNHQSRLYCPACVVKYGFCVSDRAKVLTLAELRERLIHLSGKHPSWVNAVVRQYNRLWNSDLLALPCAACKYSLHVELAHKRAIASFPLTATLGEINSRENNIQLCRNCHWEMDNGILSSALVSALFPKQVAVMDDAGSNPVEGTISIQ